VNRVRVARVSEVAEGQGIVVDVGGKRIALFRYQGDFFALDETCPHRGGPLHEGLIQDGVVACPWHLWLFDLKTGVSPVNPLSRVSTYSLTIQGEEIWLELR
jgi:nitrite reductase/ring-hydroxylating ferredoxin subunit